MKPTSNDLELRLVMSEVLSIVRRGRGVDPARAIEIKIFPMDRSSVREEFVCERGQQER
jgi:hypothetical protein